MGELVLGRVGPRATRPASAERAHLAVTPCSLGGSGKARGGCMLLYRRRGPPPGWGGQQTQVERALEPGRGQSVHSVGTDR